MVSLVRRAIFGLALIAGGAGSSALAGTLASEDPPEAILLVSVDTLRADRLGAYGFRPSVTPEMDALARRGTLFHNAYSTANVTQPAVVTLHSGLYPVDHGVDSNVSSASLPETCVTLAEVVREAGFRTGAFIAHPWITYTGAGLRRGFDHWDGVSYRRPEPGRESPEEYYKRETAAGPMTERVLTWLPSVKGRRFFAWVHYLDPHDPYTPPDELLQSGPLRAPREESPRDRMRRLYAAEVANVDRHFGRLLSAARAAAPRGRLLVVLTADHGEMLFDHAGFMTHGLYTYDSEIRIPLVVSGPGFAAGARVAAPVSLIDVLPTLCAIVGRPPQGSWPGVDLRRLARRGAKPSERLLFAESEYYRGADFDGDFERRVPVDGGKWRTAVSRSTKLVYYPWPAPPGYRTEAFDLEDRVQLVPRPGAAVSSLLAALTGETSRRKASPGTSLEPAQAELLRSLGYIK